MDVLFKKLQLLWVELKRWNWSIFSHVQCKLAAQQDNVIQLEMTLQNC